MLGRKVESIDFIIKAESTRVQVRRTYGKQGIIHHHHLIMMETLLAEPHLGTTLTQLAYLTRCTNFAHKIITILTK